MLRGSMLLVLVGFGQFFMLCYVNCYVYYLVCRIPPASSVDRVRLSYRPSIYAHIVISIAIHFTLGLALGGTEPLKAKKRI